VSLQVLVILNWLIVPFWLYHLIHSRWREDKKRNHWENKVGSRVEAITTNYLSVSFRHVTFWIITLSLCAKVEKNLCVAPKVWLQERDRVYMLLTILKSFYAINDLTLSYLVLIQWYFCVCNFITIEGFHRSNDPYQFTVRYKTLCIQKLIYVTMQRQAICTPNSFSYFQTILFFHSMLLHLGLEECWYIL
jgi:hypothetical protein